MQKVVLDTNVFVAAGFNPGSRSAVIIKAVREGRLEMVWDEATLRETRRIIERIPPLDWNEFSGLFAGQFRAPVPDARGKYGLIADPDDRKLAALAEACGAALVTSDDHLLSVRGQLGVAILTPDEFYRQSRDLFEGGDRG